MSVRAFRLHKSKYGATAFDGEGARLYGGRWNPQGHRAVYAADSVALTVLEVLVHMSDRRLLQHYSLSIVEQKEDQIERVWWRFDTAHSPATTSLKKLYRNAQNNERTLKDLSFSS